MERTVITSVAAAELLLVATVPVAVQINGRTRGVIHLAPDATQAEAMLAAQQIEAADRLPQHATPKRVVYVPGRILNLVTD